MTKEIDWSKLHQGIKPEVLEQAKKYGSVVIGRYAGDAIYKPEKGGTMILAPCDWCGQPFNFRRKGSRICTPCWKARDKIRALEAQLGCEPTDEEVAKLISEGISNPPCIQP